MSTADAPLMNAQTAAGLHERLRAATMAAREMPISAATAPPVRKRRVGEAAMWRLIDELHVSSRTIDAPPSHDRALRAILLALLEDSLRPLQPVPLPGWSGRVLIVRSGPWPVLRALLQQLRTQPQRPETTVLCHRQDECALRELATAVELELKPLFYPRFEPFRQTTLERVLAVRPGWTASVVLDAARTGSGRALEHVISALRSCSGDRLVWNASGQLYRLRSLREALGREQYDLVRRLLRWRAARTDEGV